MRGLKSKGHSRFGNNGNLAYQRAQAVSTLLGTLLERQANNAPPGGARGAAVQVLQHGLDAGASLVGDAHGKSGDFEPDRSVEIISYWVETKGIAGGDT